MAVDTAPLLLRNRKFAFKTETTTGTFESLTTAEAVTRVFDPAITYDIDTLEREDQGSLSNPLAEFGARRANVTFGTWLHGKGASGLPYWVALLPSVGMAATGSVYAPVSGATVTTSFGCYYAGSRAKYAAGCMGNAVFVGRRGEPCRINWTYSGKYIVPAADSLGAITYDTIASPRGAATFTIGATTYRAPGFEFDLGNTVILREDVTDSTGYRAAYITDRAPRLRVSLEASALGTKNWYSEMLAGTTNAGVLTIGADANNTMAFAFPKLQLVTSPNEGDREGMLTDELEFICVRNTDAGNDEYSLTFS